MDDKDIIAPYDWVKSENIIKVIGVGGGGCNAVEHMYKVEDIKGADFIVCNTDKQALRKSEVPCKIQIGGELTKGLGAGCDPLRGRKAALESQEDIKEALGGKTEMVFVTCGMGGGTGTGAAPVIADIAHKIGLLTVGVVTVPFEDEGYESMSRAIEGIHEMEKCVDSLLIINNEKLYEYFGDLLIQDAFPKADEVLATAVRGVIEIITTAGHINVDFQDVSTMMRNSGMALMGCGHGTGENRIEDAVKQALESPLLNDFDLKTAKNVLINITVGNNSKGLSMKELDMINTKINEYTGNANNFKRGIILDDNPETGDRISITVIATGFKMNMLSSITDVNIGNLIMVDSDFVYDRKAALTSGEVELPESQANIKIGYNDSSNVRKFHFSADNIPALIVEEGQSISSLESVAAIRRALTSDSR